jgi:hypothetical protein
VFLEVPAVEDLLAPVQFLMEYPVTDATIAVD